MRCAAHNKPSLIVSYTLHLILPEPSLFPYPNLHSSLTLLRLSMSLQAARPLELMENLCKVAKKAGSAPSAPVGGGETDGSSLQSSTSSRSEGSWPNWVTCDQSTSPQAEMSSSRKELKPETTCKGSLVMPVAAW